MIRQTFLLDQKMRKKIPHLLIPIIWTPFDAEKSIIRKIVQKIDFTEVKMAWVEFKSYNELVGLKSEHSPFAEFQEVIGSANKRPNDLPNRAEIKICYVIALSLNMLIFTGIKFKSGITRVIQTVDTDCEPVQDNLPTIVIIRSFSYWK